MKIYPQSAIHQLELDKIKELLQSYCKTSYALEKAGELRIHTRIEYISKELNQTHEFKLVITTGLYFPNDLALNIMKELRLLGIPGATLKAPDFLEIRKLAENIKDIFRWFEAERKLAYPGLSEVISQTHYEKAIIDAIDRVINENGEVIDSASESLASIRINLSRKRNELRRAFVRILSKLAKAGYVAETEEAFLNGRRVVAIFAENKRQVKGILHGESDTRRTSFIEPEETIGLNNDVFSLEHEENREVLRILRELTGKLSAYSSLLIIYHNILGEYDFISAKAKLAIDMSANLPMLTDRPLVRLEEAYHPLLFLYNKKNQKPTIPAWIELNQEKRILLISGPNAGGKTVTLKTAGLLQLMVQSGMLIPVHPHSELGIFKQLMIHIGDTQSIEFELSTYSSHLIHMKYFMENANGRTLFFIDELGSGSDPNLGGAFAEVILEELIRKHAFGIVTTHYLNLKVMASKTLGIMNAAMAFDEKNLQPLYKLVTGKPGSSYTFSIAERIGLEPNLIQKAKNLVDEDHFRLDKLLNRTEQDLQFIDKEKKELQEIMKENERLKKEMETIMNRERHQQQLELHKHQNKITEDRIAYLKDMERKLKQILFDWRKSEDKNQAMSQMQNLLFRQKEKQVNEKVKKKFEQKYTEVVGEAKTGDKVMMKKNHQVGLLKEIRGKKAIVQIGLLPITVDLTDLTVVRDKPGEEKKERENN